MKNKLMKAVKTGWEISYKPFCKGYALGSAMWLIVMIPVSLVAGWFLKDVD